MIGHLEIPSRTRSAGSYRYGFNGKESDDEVSVGDGSYDFGARMYDARLGRWWSVDREFRRFASHTPYSYVVNSMMVFIDPTGDCLRIAKGPSTEEYKESQSTRENFEIARNDIYGLMGEYIDHPDFATKLAINDDGSVIFNITREQIEATGDPALMLLYEMCDSDKEYLYEVNGASSYLLEGEIKGNFLDDPFFSGKTDPETGEPIPDNHQVENLARTPKTYKSSINEYTTAMNSSQFPTDPFVDGHVFIAPNTKFVCEYGTNKTMNRGALVLHELLENYFRVEYKLPYWPEPSEGFDEGSHTKAIDVVSGLDSTHQLYTPTPGKASFSNNPQE